MKKAFSLLLVVCLLCAAVSYAAAEEVVAEIIQYRNAPFTATLPAGTWYESAGENGITYYYDNPLLSGGDRMYMFLQQEANLGITVPESMLGTLYDSLMVGLAANAVNGDTESEDSTIAGVKSRLFVYDQDIDGTIYTVAGNAVLLDDKILVVCYADRGKTKDEIKAMVLTVSDTVTLEGEEGNATEVLEEAVEEVAESEILFRGIPWGASFNEVLKAFPEGAKIRDPQIKDYWYLTDDMLYDESAWSDKYTGEMGCYSYVQSSTLKEMQVAGYDIEDLYLYFVFVPGDDGLLVKDKEHTALVYAYYKLEPKDPDAAYSDLLTKLTGLYGDVDLHQSKAPYISYEQSLWEGGNGSKVSLVREDYPSGSHYIYIKYGFAGADELMKKAYDALVLEESLNAVSNTDGL